MNRIINRIKIFYNDNDKSRLIKNILINNINKYHFEVVDENYDLGIAIGGDGSFLRMVKQTSFNSKVYYVGINAGTLGFLQEIKPEEIELFIARINNNDFKIDKIGVQETIVNTTKESSRFYSLNEVVIRDKNLNTINFDIKVENNLLERFTGDGVMIATTTGSTAYNLSYGGSIVYGTLHTLQITPIAPLNNKAYRTLYNSVIIPDDKEITIIPDKNNQILISIDGENKIYKNIQNIKTHIDQKKISCLRMNDFNYSKVINEKFLK